MTEQRIVGRAMGAPDMLMLARRTVAGEVLNMLDRHNRAEGDYMTLEQLIANANAVLAAEKERQAR